MLSNPISFAVPLKFTDFKPLHTVTVPGRVVAEWKNKKPVLKPPATFITSPEPLRKNATGYWRLDSSAATLAEEVSRDTAPGGGVGAATPAI